MSAPGEWVDYVLWDLRAIVMRALEQCDQTSNSHDWIANEARDEMREVLAKVNP